MHPSTARDLSNPTRLPFILFCAALLGLVLAAPACSCGSDGVFTPGEECEDEGTRDGDLRCDGGVWVFEDDVFLDDVGADVSCDPETHREFCDRYQVECGSFTELDNCQQERTVHCGALEGFQCEEPRVCSHASDSGGETNECVCFTPNEEDPAADICAFAGAECGTIDAGDFCEGWQEYGEVDCGGCPEGVECNSHLPNICGCPCEIDGTCYAAGDTHEENQCLVCDPNTDQEDFSIAEDGATCGDDGVCDDGECVCEESLTACGDQCVDLDSNRAHCGACDDPCEDDALCSSGECIDSCPDDQSACSGECVDLDNSDDHCGECDSPCTTNILGAEASCEEGECTIACVVEGHTRCDGVCVDLDSDRNHCGQCGDACEPSELCHEGGCQPFAGGGCENNDDCGNFQKCCNTECIPNAAQCPG